MDKPILVTGGTGTLGRLVVARLREAGRDVRVLNRHGGGAEADATVEYLTGDLATGAGVEAAVEGIEVIVHCAGARVGDDATTRNLVRAASRAGARHLVYISVVGADRIPVRSRIDRAMFGYFGSKLAAEQVVAGSGHSLDDASRDPVPAVVPGGRTGDGEAARDPGSERLPIPADRRPRGRGAARRTGPR